MRLPGNMLCARLLTTSRASKSILCICSRGRRHAARKPKQAKIALPSEPTEKITMWKKHLTAEIAATLNANEAIENIQFRGFDIDPIDGNVFKFETPSTISKEDATRYRHLFTKGVWIQVQLDGKGGTEWSGIVLKQVDDVVSVRLFDLPRATLAEEAESISIKLNDDRCALNSVLEFWSDQDKWKNMPGYKNFLRAHRALPFDHGTSRQKFVPFIKNLNKYQHDAVGQALDKNRSFLSIQGPPGTGKTNVVVEIVAQAVRRNKNVLVLASSNQAVDNVASRVHALLDNSHDHCRPSISASTAPYSMPSKMGAHASFDRLAATCEEGTISGQGVHIGAADRLRNVMHDQIVGEAQVIYSTLTSSSLRKLKRRLFTADLVIVDEAGQAAEFLAWYGIMHAPRAIVVGDHHQLGPHVKCSEAAADGFNRSVQEYLDVEFSGQFQLMLRQQYRANERIMQWSNDTFYRGELKADESVCDIELSDLVNLDALTAANAHTEPLVFVDTAHADLTYSEYAVGHSFANRGEAQQIEAQVRALIAAGIHVANIGVITPYMGQTQLLKANMSDIPGLAVSPVDSFQGQEREVICISMVRSRLLGFLNELKRVNVSLTRAKRQLYIVANSRLLMRDPTLAKLVQHLRRHAKVVELAPSMAAKRIKGRSLG